MADTELKVIELDPAVWMRGQPDGALLRFTTEQQRRQCCIGVACTAFGMPDGVIGGNGAVHDLDIDDLVDEFRDIAHIQIDHDDETEYIDNDRLGTVYQINDIAGATDEERVVAINAELERIGAKFRFALKGQAA